MKNIIALSLLLILTKTNSFAQNNIGIGTTTPNASAQLEVSSTNKGLLIPRMTAVQRQAINPAVNARALMVFDTDSSAFFFWTGTVWSKMGGGGGISQWFSDGNNIYNSNTGNVGIGVLIPQYKLDVNGRIRVKALPNQLNSTAGIWFAKENENGSGAFVGNENDSIVGIYADDGAGWSFRMNMKNGKIGIADANPVARLSIGGNIKIADGTQGIGKVLTSDANGVAGWQTLPPVPSQFWVVDGNNITNSNSGNVGIGVSFPPQSKLVVIGNAAIGSQISSTGDNALATGFFTFASGNNSFSGGSYSSASGENALAFGNSSEATALNAAAFGLAIRVNVQHSFGVGSYNSIEDINTPFPNQRIFQVGNGVASNIRRNAFTVLRNGNVGIGVDAPDAPLHFVSDTRNRKIVLWSSINNDHQFYGFGVNANTLRYQIATTADDHVFFSGASTTTSAELMRIKGNGNIGLGVTDPAFVLDVGGRMRIRATPGFTAGLWFNNQANTAIPAFIGMQADNLIGVFGAGNGWVFNINTTTGNANLSGSLTTNSDARLKKDIVPLSNSLEAIQQLSGYSYHWKDASNPEEQIGLLAQEIQKVYPQLVKENEQGTLSVSYSGMVPVLLEAIKEQQKQIEELKKMLLMMNEKAK